jgi:hypothetical protein
MQLPFDFGLKNGDKEVMYLDFSFE